MCSSSLRPFLISGRIPVVRQGRNANATAGHPLPAACTERPMEPLSAWRDPQYEQARQSPSNQHPPRPGLMTETDKTAHQTGHRRMNAISQLKNCDPSWGLAFFAVPRPPQGASATFSTGCYCQTVPPRFRRYPRAALPIPLNFSSYSIVTSMASTHSQVLGNSMCTSMCTLSPAGPVTT